MALDFSIHWKTFARVDLNPKVKSEFWSEQFADIHCLFNFDGELLGLGHHIEDLMGAGFKGPYNETPECCWNQVWEPQSWLQLYTILPHDKTQKPFTAIGLTSGKSNLIQNQFTYKVFTRDIDSTWELFVTEKRE